MLLVYCLVAVVLLALTIAIYSGTGGRAWFGTRERPQEIIGRSVQLADCDGFGDASVSPPPGIIIEHDAENYRLEFRTPFVIDGREEHFAWVRARHIGYPVSAAARRATFIYGSLESGRQFIARMSVS
jgi:hypothetical protein